MDDSDSEAIHAPHDLSYLTDVERQFYEVEHALSSLELFRQYMAASDHNDFVFPHQQHHRVVAHHLERVVRGEIKRLMVCC